MGAVWVPNSLVVLGHLKRYRAQDSAMWSQQRLSASLAVRASRDAPINSSGQQRLILRYRVNFRFPFQNHVYIFNTGLSNGFSFFLQGFWVDVDCKNWLR